VWTKALIGIPFQQLVDRVEQGHYDLSPAPALHFDGVQEARSLLDSASAGGKIVIEGSPA
jgi:NADPH2:quinone reductase